MDAAFRAKGFLPFSLQLGQDDKGGRDPELPPLAWLQPLHKPWGCFLLWVRHGCLRPLPSSSLHDLKGTASAVKPLCRREIPAGSGQGALLLSMVPKKRHRQPPCRSWHSCIPPAAPGIGSPAPHPTASWWIYPLCQGLSPSVSAVHRTGALEEDGREGLITSPAAPRDEQGSSALTLGPISPGGPIGPWGP